MEMEIKIMMRTGKISNLEAIEILMVKPQEKVHSISKRISH
jgi:hypothetical protein